MSSEAKRARRAEQAAQSAGEECGSSRQGAVPEGVGVVVVAVVDGRSAIAKGYRYGGPVGSICGVV